MLEGVFHEGDKHQRGNFGIGHLGRYVRGDAYLVGIAQLHQMDIVHQEFHFAPHGHQMLVGLVEHIAHDSGEDEDGFLGPLGIDVYQRMDVVERVHVEMRINLILQISQLLTERTAFQLAHLLLVLQVLEVELHTEVHAEHEYHHHQLEKMRQSDTYRRPVVVVSVHHPPLSVTLHLPAVFRIEFVRTVDAVAMHPWRTVPHAPRIAAHHLHSRTRSAACWSALTLIAYENGKQTGHPDKIGQFPVLVDEHRSERKIVNKENYEIDQIDVPHHEHVVPLEHIFGIVGGTHIDAHQGRYEQDCP